MILFDTLLFKNNEVNFVEFSTFDFLGSSVIVLTLLLTTLKKKKKKKKPKNKKKNKKTKSGVYAQTQSKHSSSTKPYQLPHVPTKPNSYVFFFK